MRSFRVTLCTVSAMLLVLTACRALNGTGEDLQRSVSAYNRMQRWQEGSEAVARFVVPLHQPDYLRHATGDQAPHIVDYRIGQLTWQTPGSVALVPVELDYYIPPSVTVKTIVDQQEWHYTEGQGWQITSPPPEFP